VLFADGVYIYDAVANVLKPVVAGDARAKVGTPAQASAPVTIAYVSDVKNDKYSSVDTGFIGQNVFLFAASEGLGAWFHAIHGDGRFQGFESDRGSAPALRSGGWLSRTECIRSSASAHRSTHRSTRSQVKELVLTLHLSLKYVSIHSW